MNRGRAGAVHGGMNRPDLYMKQLAAQAAWLRAQGDDDGAALAEELAERIHDRHEGVDDQTTPGWADGDVVDAAPDIRCWPAVGVVLRGDDGDVLTIDPEDGGNVMVVHLGDVARYLENGVRAAVEREAADDAARQAHDATVGDVIDAEFENDGVAAERVARHADPELKRLQAKHPDLPPDVVAACADDIHELDAAIEEDDGAFGRFRDPRAEGMSVEQYRSEDLTEDPE